MISVWHALTCTYVTIIILMYLHFLPIPLLEATENCFFPHYMNYQFASAQH